MGYGGAVAAADLEPEAFRGRQVEVDLVVLVHTGALVGGIVALKALDVCVAILADAGGR